MKFVSIGGDSLPRTFSCFKINTPIREITKLPRYIFPWMVALIRITKDMTVWSIRVEVNEEFLVISLDGGGEQSTDELNYETVMCEGALFIIYCLFWNLTFTEHFLELNPLSFKKIEFGVIPWIVRFQSCPLECKLVVNVLNLIQNAISIVLEYFTHRYDSRTFHYF